MDDLSDIPPQLPETPRIAGRWRGFSVRTLMLITLAVGLLCAFYAWGVRQSVGLGPHSGLGNLKIFIPLDIQVVDDATDRPIPGAQVQLGFLRPKWNGENPGPAIDLNPAAVSDEEGKLTPQLTTSGRTGRRLAFAFYGLVPVAGNREIVFPPDYGAQVRADGYEPWTAVLEDLAIQSGRPLKNIAPFPVVVRLKRLLRHK